MIDSRVQSRAARAGAGEPDLGRAVRIGLIWGLSWVLACTAFGLGFLP